MALQQFFAGGLAQSSKLTLTGSCLYVQASTPYKPCIPPNIQYCLMASQEGPGNVPLGDS